MKRQYLKLCGISFVVLLLAGACTPVPTPAQTPTPVPPAPAPGPVDRVMAFQGAFNSGAVDQTAAMFVDDSVGIILSSLGLAFNPSGVRNILDYATAAGLQLEFSDCKPEGEVVNCSVLLRDEACLKSAGLNPAHGTAKIKFLGDKINLLTTTTAKEDDTKLVAASFPAFGCGQCERRYLVEKLGQSAGADLTARQQGEAFKQLCNDWAAAKK
jgi:hypothetical protein